MPIEVRAIQPDELVAFIDTISTGFLERPNVAGIAEEVRQHWDLTRARAAFDDGRMVASLRSWAGRLTVPGCAELPVSSVSGISVTPTHRRRGLLGRLIAAEHAAARERGEAIAVLFASEYPIYGRFGYGPSTATTDWTVHVRDTGFVDLPADPGRMELVTPDESAMTTAQAIYERWRVRQPGETWRRPITWRDSFGLTEDVWGNHWKGFFAIHRDASGEADGYVRYHGEEQWVDRQPRNRLIVDDLHGLSEAAQAGLWRFVASIDLVDTVKAERRSPDDRLPWLLTNRRAAVAAEVGDGMWLKMLDIPRALETRRYERSGSLVLEIVDRDGNDDAGAPIERRSTIALEVSPDGSRASDTDRPPDLTLTAGALGAAYLGGTRLSRAVLWGGFEEHRPGALADAEALFATIEAPWCSSFF